MNSTFDLFRLDSQQWPHAEPTMLRELGAFVMLLAAICQNIPVVKSGLFLTLLLVRTFARLIVANKDDIL